MMDNRKQALAILEEAQELLANRLIESIIESKEGILEDADGCSYMDEIDSLQERIGGRLANINLMIVNLPPEKAEPNESEPTASYASATEVGSDDTVTEKPKDFALFGQQIGANDIDGAGQTLAKLLDVDHTVAYHCATAFRDRLNEDPTTIQKAMQLRTKLVSGKHNDSLMILWDCFGLQGPQAIEVMATLKARLVTA
jgi:hypothetical protein